MAHDVERVFADIDADHGDRSTGCLGHGVLLVLAPLASLSLAGQEHGRTIPLAEVPGKACFHREQPRRTARALLSSTILH
ncbi:hypothetical protein EI171_13165 [Bradyrhizobium sp. LCT2]|nr:hypothetical protein EI171_13165 [Bradyrhizobium sp. LCT2]